MQGPQAVGGAGENVSNLVILYGRTLIFFDKRHFEASLMVLGSQGLGALLLSMSDHIFF
jgi:hypothetical protein